MLEQKPWVCLDCRIIMIKIDDDHCKCPNCKTEVWYQYDAPDLNEDDLPEERGTETNAQTQYVSRSLPERYRVPPGGAKAGKRAKKKGTKIYVDDIGFEG